MHLQLGAKIGTILYRRLIGGFKKMPYNTILTGGLKRLDTPPKHMIHLDAYSFHALHHLNNTKQHRLINLQFI